MAELPKWLTFKNVAGGIVLAYAAGASLNFPIPRWTWIWEHEALASEVYNARLSTDLRLYHQLYDSICVGLGKGREPRPQKLQRWRDLAKDINRVSIKLKRKPVESDRPRCR